MLAVPPAPGMRPRPISGSAAVKSVRAQDPVGKGRELHPRAGARPVHPGHEAGTQGGDRPPDTRGQSHHVGGGRVAEGAELVEIAAAAEARPLSAEHDLGQGMVGCGQCQAHRGARRGGTGSSALRTWGRLRTRSRRSPVRITLTAGPRLRVGVPGGTAGPPRPELRPRLQHGIGGGLGHQGPAQRR